MKMLSLAEAATIFAEVAVEMDHMKHHCLDEGSKILQDQRERQGYAPNDPLLVTGDLRDSIERDVQHNVAYVGSNNNKALWHEMGTSRIPPRPFFGGAVEAKHHEIGELVGKKFHTALITK